jgi:hypothetical protein
MIPGVQRKVFFKIPSASCRRFARKAVAVIAAVWGSAALEAQADKSPITARSAGNAASDRAANPAPDPEPGRIATRFWIDPRQGALPSVPGRKVIIEYHNSKHMPRLGDQFDADEFGDPLLEARINGMTVFAKDMFGYSCYPSKRGPVHPACRLTSWALVPRVLIPEVRCFERS